MHYTAATGTQFITTIWAWRTPTLIQIAPSILNLLVLLFVPESPRWLISQDRHEEALEVLVIVNFNSAKKDPVVLPQYREIAGTIS